MVQAKLIDLELLKDNLYEIYVQIWLSKQVHDILQETNSSTTFLGFIVDGRLDWNSSINKVKVMITYYYETDINNKIAKFNSICRTVRDTTQEKEERNPVCTML